jgi:hypothetical protein
MSQLRYDRRRALQLKVVYHLGRIFFISSPNGERKRRRAHNMSSLLLPATLIIYERQWLVDG